MGGGKRRRLVDWGDLGPMGGRVSKRRGGSWFGGGVDDAMDLILTLRNN